MDFGARVTEAVEQGYGHQVDEEVKEELVAEFFLKGCSDKANACKALERQPNTLKKALEYMERYAYTSSFIYGKHPSVGINRVHGSQMSHAEVWSVEAPFKSNHHQGYRGQQEQGRSNFQRRCYACDQIGHIKRDCPNVACYQCHQHGHRGSVCPNGAVNARQGSGHGDSDEARREGVARVNGSTNVTREAKQKSSPFEMDVQLEDGKMLKALIDTGSEVTILNACFKGTIKGGQRLSPIELKGVLSKETTKADVIEDVSFSIEGNKFSWTMCFLPMEYEMILGADFLSETSMRITAKGVSIQPSGESYAAGKVFSLNLDSIVEQERASGRRSCTAGDQSKPKGVKPKCQKEGGIQKCSVGKEVKGCEKSDSVLANFVEDWYT